MVNWVRVVQFLILGWYVGFCIVGGIAVGVILDKESSDQSSLQVEQGDFGTVKTQGKELNTEELSKLSAFKDFVDTLDLEGLE